ncbi:hypothetical protein G3I19_28310 [Streptomyces sp. SID10853]|uniref:DMT family transporter n=1 Tax=Streptomyces sp. SID10853 TaxID=2706028 RepID=UPI0013C130F3|nr:DMT family transporter [Streptomyces sp. SID10853]NDZ82371.1 hypothetical protein [Streptomyces sp. SID10853]
MSALALSVLLSLVSAVAYAAGAIVQERVAAATPGSPYAPLRHSGWWAAMTLNGVGAGLHVIALAYGPLSLVQPLGALTIVFALPMAAVFVRRRAGAAAWRGAIMATVGLAGLLALTGGADNGTLPGGERTVLALATFGGIAALFLVALRMRKPVVRSIVLATAAGVAFGAASVFTKTVAVDLTSHAPTAEWLSLLAIAGFAGTGVLLSQASYRGAGLAAPLATVTVVNPVLAAAIGVTLFGEDFRYGVTGEVLALACGVVAAGGLILLTTERLSADRPRSGEQGGSGERRGSEEQQGPGEQRGPGQQRGSQDRSAAAHVPPPGGPSPHLVAAPARRPRKGDQTATPPALR